MATLTIDLPDEVFEPAPGSARPGAGGPARRRDPLVRGRAGLAGTGAGIAGLDRTDFLLALARERVDAFPVDLTEIRRESQGV